MLNFKAKLNFKKFDDAVPYVLGLVDTFKDSSTLLLPLSEPRIHFKRFSAWAWAFDVCCDKWLENILLFSRGKNAKKNENVDK